MEKKNCNKDLLDDENTFPVGFFSLSVVLSSSKGRVAVINLPFGVSLWKTVHCW